MKARVEQKRTTTTTKTTTMVTQRNDAALEAGNLSGECSRHRKRRRRRRRQHHRLPTEPETSDDGATHLKINRRQQQHQKQQQQQQKEKSAGISVCEVRRNKDTGSARRPPLAICRRTSTGELVCSAAHNGHLHRPSVSWRFLWRAYALYDLTLRRPIDDRGGKGRTKLSELSIRSGQTLKFCSRVMYFGRTRQ